MPKYERIRLTDRTGIKYREVAERAGLEHPRVWTADMDERERMEAIARGEESAPEYEEMRETWPLSEAHGSRNGTLRKFKSMMKRLLPGSR